MESASKSDSLALKLYEACEKGNEGAVRRLARSIVSDMTQDVSVPTTRAHPPSSSAASPATADWQRQTERRADSAADSRRGRLAD